MPADSKLHVSFWSEAVASTFYTLNHILIVKRHGNTLFEQLNRHKPNLKWLEPFGSPCTVLDPDGKFDSKALEGFFMEYASPLRRVHLPSMNRTVQVQHVDCQRFTTPTQKPGDAWMFNYDNLWTCFNPQEEEVFDEAIYMMYQKQLFDVETPEGLVLHDSIPESTPIFDDDGETYQDVIESLIQIGTPSIGEMHLEENVSNLQQEVIVTTDVIPYTMSYHPEENIIEPKPYKEPLIEEIWVSAMQEELQHFEKLGVWKLVDLPKEKKRIKTKWVFKCKRDENGTMKKLITVDKIHTDEQIVDLLTKAFDKTRFQYLLKLNGIKNLGGGNESDPEIMDSDLK
ncbi:uncharacterized protein LOC143577979 [Bidens hawaiensis]|uniref:uncharacterized protein LOC143577979 n=1 Tax=Bidens hawaiensis TaxID=980011 RepID=UPI00404A3410